MGYLHIENLYRRPDFLTGEDAEVYALEKIHGTSAHLALRGNVLHLFPGGEKIESFAPLFDAPKLEVEMRRITQDFDVEDLTVYGEAYGGKCQGMRDTYGEVLRFVAFDVLVGKENIHGHRYGWLDVPEAERVTARLDIEFVEYAKVPCNLAALNVERDKDSTQALRNGCGSGKLREGIVIRPLKERYDRRGNRVILKHKRDEFRETKAPRQVDPNKLQKLQDAQAIADEWVTEERLNHVLDHMRACALDVESIKTTGEVVRAVFEDVRREGEGEIVWSKDAERAVGTRAAKLYKARVTKIEVQ